MKKTAIAALFALAPGAALGAPGVTDISKTSSGEALYATICQACHMADAKGGTGAGVIPALANNPRLKLADYPVTLIVRGRGAMPGFTDTLNPAQIAAVATYVRTHFGNSYAEPVTAAQVETRIKALGAQ